jgi:hypothetical protein
LAQPGSPAPHFDEIPFILEGQGRAGGTGRNVVSHDCRGFASEPGIQAPLLAFPPKKQLCWLFSCSWQGSYAFGYSSNPSIISKKSNHHDAQSFHFVHRGFRLPALCAGETGKILTQPL